MIPWGLRWNSWRWSLVWTYRFTWWNHPIVVILAGVGVLSLLWMVVRLGWR